MNSRPQTGCRFALAILVGCIGMQSGFAVEAIRITKANYAAVAPQGKEVDAIVGDWVLRNRSIVAVIAQTTPGRKANMTVRGVAGTLIDFTSTTRGSDQLSCFYPAGSSFLFEEPNALSIIIDGVEQPPSEAGKYSAEEISIVVRGLAIGGQATTATVTYTLNDHSDALAFQTSVTNTSDIELPVASEVGLRCDGSLFVKRVDPPRQCYLAEDSYFRQTYAIRFSEGGLTADNARTVTIRRDEQPAEPLPAGETLTWSGAIACSEGAAGAASWAEAQLNQAALIPLRMRLQSPHGSVEHCNVEFLREGASLGAIQTDAQGMLQCSLQPGEYTANITSQGRPDRSHAFVVTNTPASENISLPPPSRVRAQITDAQGKPIAAKVQFLGTGQTPNPNFGPDSAIYAVKNLVYSASGKFEQPLNPGQYTALVSHGPEYDVQTIPLVVTPDTITDLKCALPRSVDTRGWVSAEYHSHSSPSGDNVSHQTGRVLNLLAEHLEFAPCTEHNRIDTYADDLELLKATDRLATCPGMELTGSPLPVNHQNAFPMQRHEHMQDGGGPSSDVNPIKQIERLALWDNASEKLVQSNHPNIPQILGDRDLNGKPDDGFRGMLGWMDVIEIHPLQTIFTPPEADVAPQDKSKNRVFAWMQLLNLGYRIPGVVNTDAHYNFHGSGWLRNYVASPVDDPAKILVEDMVEASQRGHIIMTTGPFLEVGIFDGQTSEEMVMAGDDLHVPDGQAGIYMRVQCPNWFDVNRVQVFANGRPLEEMNFTRKTHPALFSNANVRFQHLLDLPKFDVDTHIIVATIGEGLTLGDVMGPDKGQLPPVAISNPIFLDVDGGGFQANGDDLGVPVMVAP